MIFSHVLYHLSYPAAESGLPRGKPVLILEYRARVIKGWRLSRDLKGSFPCFDHFWEKRWSSKAVSIISLGRAPTTALGGSPGSKRAMVGMLEIPK
jgi:hypothetical protein